MSRTLNIKNLKKTICWFSLAMFVALSAGAVSAAPFVPERNAQCATFSPDGTLAATGKSGLSNEEFPPRPHPLPSKCGVIHIWDMATGKKVHRMETFGDFSKLKFSPDGKILAVARLFLTSDGIEMNEVRLWNVATGKTVHRFDRCHSFAFSPLSHSIAVLSRSRCVVYDLGNFSKQQSIVPLGQAIAIDFSEDGSQIAGIVPLEKRYAVRLCQTISGKQIAQSPALEQPFYSLAFSPGRKLLVTGHDHGTVLLWQTEDMTLLARYHTENDDLQHPFFSPDGNLLASASQQKGDVVFWDMETGKQLFQYTFERGSFRTYYPRKPNQQVRPELDPNRFGFSPDGEAFIAGCYGGIVRLLRTGQDIRRFTE